MKNVLLFLTCLLFINTSLQAQTWSKLGSGISGTNQYAGGVYAMCIDSNGYIYAAGDFYVDTIPDTNYATHVFKWNGTSWSELGTGISSPGSGGTEVYALCADTNGNIYAAGLFYNDSGYYYVAKWNGSSWSELGGMNTLHANGEILSICIDKYSNIYAAGTFSDTSGYLYVAKWDGTSWSEIGTGSNALKANSAINIVFVDTFGNVYAGGTFTDSTTDSSGNIYIAKWNGTTWSELGTGIVPQYGYLVYEIYSILVDTSGNVYAAGFFFDSSNKCYVSP